MHAFAHIVCADSVIFWTSLGHQCTSAVDFIIGTFIACVLFMFIVKENCISKNAITLCTVCTEGYAFSRICLCVCDQKRCLFVHYPHEKDSYC